MKTTLTAFLSLILTIFSLAQTEDSNVQVGFGVSLSKELSMFIQSEQLEIMTLPVDLANFTVIIKGKNFRFEPSLGFFTTSSDYSNAGYNSESSTSNTRLGAVLAYNNSSIVSMNFYYGVDFGVILTNYSHSSSTSTESTDESKTDFFIGPAVGGEYMFNKHFSLGGEINLNYISVGEFDGDSEGESSIWAISTRGVIYLRWYVN